MRSKPKDVVKNIDFYYISHTHEDHFHFLSLKLFSKKTKFLIQDFSSNKKLDVEK
jgi:L-ascorbate metabolism protein UlaG (beta-lactamase superfamily)